MRNLIAIVVLLFGCQTYDGLYIDDSCTQREVELIEIAVEKLNTAVGEEVVISHGVHNCGTGDIGSLEDRDVVFCNEDPEIGGEEMLGKEHVQDIFLRHQEDDDMLLHTIMHELGHYIGAWHITDESAVMYHVNNGVTDYTHNDINSINKVIY